MSQELSRAERIRQFLTGKGPQTAAVICGGIGETGSLKAMHSIGTLVTGGFLRRIGESRPYRYELVRADFVPRPVRLTPEQRRERRRERQRANDRAKGVRSREQWNAELAARRAAKGVKVITTENAARDKRDTARQIVAMRSSALAAAPVKDDRPCTDAWLTEHGHDPAKYQVLKPGEWSAPLRFEY